MSSFKGNFPGAKIIAFCLHLMKFLKCVLEQRLYEKCPSLRTGKPMEIAISFYGKNI